MPNLVAVCCGLSSEATPSLGSKLPLRLSGGLLASADEDALFLESWPLGAAGISLGGGGAPAGNFLVDPLEKGVLGSSEPSCSLPLEGEKINDAISGGVSVEPLSEDGVLG